MNTVREKHFSSAVRNPSGLSSRTSESLPKRTRKALQERIKEHETEMETPCTLTSAILEATKQPKLGETH